MQLLFTPDGPPVLISMALSGHFLAEPANAGIAQREMDVLSSRNRRATRDEVGNGAPLRSCRARVAPSGPDDLETSSSALRLVSATWSGSERSAGRPVVRHPHAEERVQSPGWPAASCSPVKTGVVPGGDKEGIPGLPAPQAREETASLSRRPQA